MSLSTNYTVTGQNKDVFSLVIVLKTYFCKFGNFRENFIFANSIKSHICQVKISRLGHDSPISLNDRVISRGFYFHETSHVRSFAKIKNPPENFRILKYLNLSLHTEWQIILLPKWEKADQMLLPV